MKGKIISASIALSMILAGCGTDSSKTQEFDISQNLDKKNYQAVIDVLGDCSGKEGDAKSSCLTNLGAAYYGLAKFDIISLGQELLSIDSKLTDSQKDDEFTKIIFGKLVNDNTKKGTDAFTTILTDVNQKNNCTEAGIDKDTGQIKDKRVKNACLSISPILLKDSLEDKKNTGAKSTTFISLNEIIEFKDVIQNAVPGLTSSQLVSIVNDKEITGDDDLNGNKDLDAVEVSQCVIKAYETNGTFSQPASCTTANITLTELSQNVFNGTGVDAKYSNIYSLKGTVSGSGKTKDYYRLLKHTGVGNIYTLVSVDNTKTVNTSVVETQGTINGTTILDKPLLASDGKLNTLDKSLTNVLNNVDKFKAIANLVEAENDKKTESQKVDDLLKEICDKNNNGNNTDAGECVSGTGVNGIKITQEAFLDYANKK